MYLVCWNHDCRQTYPAENYKVTDRGINCPKCGDTLISPSGKVQLSMNDYVIKTVDPAKLSMTPEERQRKHMINDCVTWTAHIHGLLASEIDRKEFEDMDDETLGKNWDWLYDLMYLK